MRILISAGEASGDMYGAQLIDSLRSRLTPGTELRSAGQPLRLRRGQAVAAVFTQYEVEFFGAGGDRMRAAGCDIVVDSKDLAVVGISEIVSHLPKIYGLFHRLIAEADRRRPDLAVVIDSPAFNWRVARQMRKRGIPVVYYVCPQFWAWRQGRVRLLRKYVDKSLVIFPFEEKFYRDREVDATFVGHPLADLRHHEVTRDQYAAENGLIASRQWITLMPGSREREVRMNLPEMLWAANLLGDEYEFVLPVAPTISKDLILELMKSDTFTVAIHLTNDAVPALAHSRAGIIASGTATIEAAMVGTPFVMVYRVSPLTYFLGRSRVKVSHFAMPNLIAGKEIVPELVQHEFSAKNIVARIREILPDGPARARMVEGLAEVRTSLRGPDSDALYPADRAAEVIVTLLRQSPAET